MNHASASRMMVLFVFAAASAGAACATNPTMGGGSGNTVTGSAAGGSSQGANKDLERCAETMGTLAVVEDQGAAWYHEFHGRYPTLGSTVPVLRMMIQQSNCFVVVERGRAMNNMMQERNLERSGEMRQGSNFGGGQMVAADYTMSPTIQLAAKDTSGVKGAIGGFGILGAAAGAVAGGLKSNEAATTLLLTDNRSGVQLAGAEGSASNMDFDLFGGAVTHGGVGAGLGGYSKTPEGKIIIAAFADSYNQMVRSLRNYRAQTVQGGLGTGGKLGVQGGSTPASPR